MNLEQQYDELCAERDRVNKLNEPIEAELAQVVAICEEARVKAEALAAKIDDNRGREKWIALKRDIRILAPAIEKARAAKREQPASA